MANSIPHYEIDLEESFSEKQRVERHIKVNTLIRPFIRLVGFTFLLILVWLLNLKQLNSHLTYQLLAFSLGTYGYCLTVWFLLYLFYKRRPWKDWQIFFPPGDLIFLTLVVYFTGGNASLLFFIYLSRPAMQLTNNSPKAVFFNLISPLFYLGLLIYLSRIEGRSLDYPLEAIKIIVLFVIGFYLTMVARQVDTIRQKVGFYYQAARDAIGEKTIGAEKRYHELLDRIPNIIFRCDLNGRITYYNKTAANLLGYSYPTETNNLNLFPEFLYDTTPLKDMRNDIEEFGFSNDRVLPVKKKNGTTIWLAATIYPLRNSTGEIISYEGIMRNVTGARRLEEERLKREQELELIAKASTLFASSLELEKILEEMARLTLEVFGDVCSILIPDQKQEILRPLFVTATDPETRDRNWNYLQEFPLQKESLGWKTFESGEPHLMSETMPALNSHPRFKALNILSYLAVPIKTRTKTLGVLACIIDHGEKRFSQGDVLILQTLADRAAMAIENAALFKDVELLEKKRYALFEHAGDAIFIYDTRGNILEANESACKSLGYTLPELIGMNANQIKSPESGSQIEPLIASIIKNKQLIFEHEHLRKDGTAFPVEIMARLIELPGQPVIQSITRDITERKKAEAESLAKTRMNAMLLDSLPCLAMLLKTNSREIILSNREGQNAGGIPGKHCFRAFSQRETPCPWCLGPEAWTAGTRQHKEVETNDGHVWDLYWIPLGRDQYIHYAFDITEHKRMERQLIQAQKMEAIGQLAGGIAHDFNNILTGITGYTSLMKLKMDEDNAFFHGISIIEKSAWRAAELTRQLLGFARGGKYEIKEMHLHSVVNNVLGIIRETFDRAIAIHTSLPQEIWPVEGDPGQLEQVLLNICLNARDALPLGGRLSIETSNIFLDEIFTRTHLGTDEGEYVLLTISDTGKGIPPEIQGKIFDPFFTTKEIGKGTGMGLAMAYGIVKNHGGYISVYSEAGRGSCFKIYLPASKKIPQKKTILSNVAIPVGSGTILLVDDEEVVRELGKTTLESLGYQVVLARDGKEACAIFAEKSGRIDLVLLDMIMPEMGGTETYHALKRINSQIKVLFCSGYTVNGQAIQILTEGAQGFVQKPFNLQQLAQSVWKALTST